MYILHPSCPLSKYTFKDIMERERGGRGKGELPTAMTC
jgi:hypothetical protein